MLLRGSVLKRICCGLMCLSFLLVNSCRDSWPFTLKKVESAASPAEMKRYQQAIAAFHQKAYLDAVQLFEAIRTQTRDKKFARMALYGLAISKLMAAKTPKEYSNALLLWHHWTENSPLEYEYENPALVDALIREKMLFSNIPLTSEQPQEKEKEQEPMVSQWLLIESKLELDRLRSQLESSKTTLEKREKTIQAKEKVIRELKRQIKAMETIDQKIQKKKNAIGEQQDTTVIDNGDTTR